VNWLPRVVVLHLNRSTVVYQQLHDSRVATTGGNVQLNTQTATITAITIFGGRGRNNTNIKYFWLLVKRLY